MSDGGSGDGRDQFLHDRPTVVPDETVARAPHHQPVPQAPQQQPPPPAGEPVYPADPGAYVAAPAPVAGPPNRSLWWIPVGTFAVGLIAVAGVFLFMYDPDDDALPTTTTTASTTTASTTSTAVTTTTAPSTTTAAPPTTSRPTVATTAPPTTSPPTTSLETVATERLRSWRDADRSSVDALVGVWVPQVSAKKDGGEVPDHPDGPKVFTEADVAADHEGYRNTYGYGGPGGALLLFSSDYNFKLGDHWVTVINEPFSTPEGANGWCDSVGLDPDNCFAKRLEHGGPFEGTVLHR